MPVQLTEMRDLLMPGLWAISSSFAQTKEMWAAEFFNNTFESVATVSLPVAVAMGAAAILIQNPEVSRRGLFSWRSDS